MAPRITTITSMTNKSHALFVDTSALIAILDAQDQYHTRIHNFLKNQTGSVQAFTTNLVLTELLTFFSRKSKLDRAIQFHHELLKNPDYSVLWIDDNLHRQAVIILKKYSDHCLSFVDATSFAVMKQLGLTAALAFDEDFVRAGFTTLP